MNRDIDNNTDGTLDMPPIPMETEARLRHYCSILSDLSSEKVRLTGPRDEVTIWNDHIRDCLFALELLPTSGRIVDVGTGGGLPGMAWAICRPDLEITLLDSQSRKTDALELMATELELSNVRIVWERSEDLAKRERESFHLASARGVSELGVVAEYLSPLIMVGGEAISIKGPGCSDEIARVGDRWGRLGLDRPVALAYVNGERRGYMVRMSKISPCPGGFPRRPGKAEKSHWWEDKK